MLILETIVVKITLNIIIIVKGNVYFKNLHLWKNIES